MPDTVEMGRGSLSSPITPAEVRDLLSTVESLRQQRDQLRSLVEHVPAVLYIDEVTEAGSGQYPTLYVSPQVDKVIGIPAEEWRENDRLWKVHMHPDDWSRVEAEYEAYLEGGEGTLVQEYRLVRPDNGETVWVRDECAIATEKGTGRSLVIGVMLDVSAQKRLEEQLRAAEAKNRALIDQIPHAVWIEPIDDHAEAPYVSPAIARVVGVPAETWLGRQWWEDHLHESDRSRVLEARRRLEPGHEPARLEYRLVPEEDRELWIGQTMQLVMSGDAPWAVQSLIEDITPRKLAEEQLEYRATHDPLTGLANRSLFAESITHALARAARHAHGVALLYGDLDDFKLVNDNHGHEAGDVILQEVARRLVLSVREADLVARPGGDEFLILLPDVEPAPGAEVPAASALAAGIAARITESLSVPISTPRGEIVVSMSLGWCTFPENGSDARELLSAADAAMYRAKT